MHLQENTLFDLKVTQTVAQYPFLHRNYSGTKFEVATYNGLGRELQLQSKKNIFFIILS